MKKVRTLLSLALVASVIFTGMFIALADQENELEFCDHEYTVTAFANGVATLECDECGDTVTMTFADYLNSRNCEELDMNSDGIVNAKDYAILIQTYSS